MLFQSLTKCLLPLMEPGVEDFLRLRREAYGKASGPVHVPPPLLPLNGHENAAAAAAARLAAATHGQYNAHAAWSASLAICAQRMCTGGRGCSVQGAAEMPLEATEWFGGSIDASGRFVRAPAAASASVEPAQSVGENRSPGCSMRTMMAVVAVTAACLAAGTLLRAQRR